MVPPFSDESKGRNLGEILLLQHPLLPGSKGRIEIRQEPQRIIGRKNRDAQKITEREQKNEVSAGQLLLPDRLLNLKGGCPEEEIPKILHDAVKPVFQILLLG